MQRHEVLAKLHKSQERLAIKLLRSVVDDACERKLFGGGVACPRWLLALHVREFRRLGVDNPTLRKLLIQASVSGNIAAK